MKDYVQLRNERWKKIFPDIKQKGFWGRIVRLAHYYHTQCDLLLAKHDLKRNEYEILCSLLYSGAPYTMTPKEITAHAFKTPGAITNGLDNLESKGLVIRMPNSENRRSTLVGLTEKGEKLIRDLFPECSEMENELLQNIDSGELLQGIECMKKLLTEFEDKGKLAIPGFPEREA